MLGTRCGYPDIGRVASRPYILVNIRIDELVKSSPAKAGQGAQKLRSEAHLSRVSRDNDEVEGQSRFERDRWTFYETIRIQFWKNPSLRFRGVGAFFIPGKEEW